MDIVLRVTLKQRTPSFFCTSKDTLRLLVGIKELATSLRIKRVTRTIIKYEPFVARQIAIHFLLQKVRIIF